MNTYVSIFQQKDMLLQYMYICMHVYGGDIIRMNLLTYVLMIGYSDALSIEWY